VEVQALTSPTVLPVPRRIANGIDFNRLLMLVAVLTRRVGINLSGQDVIVNVAGGFRVREPAADLAVALAIVSSTRDTPLDSGTAALGEVGLSGELRAVPQSEKRLSELGRLGFTSCLMPASVQENPEFAGVQSIRATNLRQAIRSSLASRREEPPFG
jgi:DNA repair protein RadA/Sms